MRQTFFLTFSLFLLVWAFSAVDQAIEKKPLKKASPHRMETRGNFQLHDVQFLGKTSTTSDLQVKELEKQINELKAMKQGLEARALRHEDQAQRLQFEDQATLETRRHLELAKENREKAAKIQQEINRLQDEKDNLLQSE